MRRRAVQAIGAAPVYDKQRDHLATALRADRMGMAAAIRGARDPPAEDGVAEQQFDAKPNQSDIRSTLRTYLI